MTSQINPATIDGAFPIQGTDNPSQGFRTNFTNTRVNFQFAQDEINDLQNKVVLKAALTGQTLSNNLDGAPLVSAVITDFSEQAVLLGTQTGTVNISYSLGHYQTLTTNGPVNLSFSNWPAAGTEGWVTVAVTVANTAHTLTLPTSVSLGLSGITGAVGSVIRFASTGVYLFTFTSSDQGTTIVISENNTLLRELNSSSENLAASAAASLAVCTSYITTTAPTTSSLAAGVEGQVKTFAMFSASGALVVSVNQAAWASGGTGTLTLTATGATATLKVINGRWFAIASNGASFT